jgi:hypothetical protein
MTYVPGQAVDAWSVLAIVQSVTEDWVVVRYPLDCGDDFLAGCYDGFPPEMLSPWLHER